MYKRFVLLNRLAAATGARASDSLAAAAGARASDRLAAVMVARESVAWQLRGELGLLIAW